MSTARYLVGDVFDRLAELPDNSVDLVLTSPPFLALRSYLPADHPDKAKEIGSEPTPGEFIDTLLALTEEWARVLAPHGSICIELGDTYSGSGGAGGDYNEGGMRDLQPRFAGSGSKHRMESAKPGTNSRLAAGPGWPEAKSLCLIPELYRIALVYGFNPLTGRTTDRWRARNVVRWCRPNPPVGALGDKFRPGTSDMVIACKAKDRYFDLDAVRTEHVYPDDNRHLRKDISLNAKGERFRNSAVNGAGAPPLDWWKISTEPYKGSHYATWPTELLIKPILSMCPTRVCTTCGEPSRRLSEVTESYRHALNMTDGGKGRGNLGDDPNVRPTGGTWYQHGHDRREAVTLGWTDCGHNTWRTGRVLDPFAGSGTTLVVATGHGRDAIGIDIDERNADLARERVGMFLDVEMPVMERGA